MLISSSTLYLQKTPETAGFLFVCFLKYCEFAYTGCAVPVILPLTARKEDAQSSKIVAENSVLASQAGHLVKRVVFCLSVCRATAVRVAPVPMGLCNGGPPGSGGHGVRTDVGWSLTSGSSKQCLVSGDGRMAKTAAVGHWPMCDWNGVWHGGDRSVTKTATSRLLTWGSLKWWPSGWQQAQHRNSHQWVADPWVTETAAVWPGTDMAPKRLPAGPLTHRSLKRCRVAQWWAACWNGCWLRTTGRIARTLAGGSLTCGSSKWWPVSRHQMHHQNGCHRIANAQVIETAPGGLLSSGSLKQPTQLWWLGHLAELLCGWFWTWAAADNSKGRCKRSDRQLCYVWKCESQKNHYVWSFWIKSILVSRLVKHCWVLETGL